MNILTKVFAVLVTILAVAFVPLVVAHAFNQPIYREQVRTLEQQLRIAERRADEARQIRDTYVSQVREELERQRLTAEERQRRFEEAQARARRFEDEKRQVELNLSEQRALTQRLTEDLRMTRERLDRAEDDRRELAADKQAHVAQIAELNRELLAREALAETLRRQVRHMEEQFAVTDRKLRELEEEIAKQPETIQAQILGLTPREDGFVADPAISAQVIGVSSERGTVFVQLNVGERDNVQRNMSFRIIRGDRFLGRLIIRDVDERTSAGIVERIQDRIRPGDEAFSGRL